MMRGHVYLFLKAKCAIIFAVLGLACCQMLTAAYYSEDEPIWFEPQKNLDDIKKLLSETQGRGIDARNSIGQTGLMYAINIGRFGDFGRYEEDSDRSGLVETLIHYGADVNARSEQSPREEDHSFYNTPLHYAVLRVNPRDAVDMIDYLVDAGAKINAQNNLGETPLMWSLQQSRLETLEPVFIGLISDLADVNIQNNIGNTYLHLIVREKDAGWIEYIMKNFGSMFDLSLKNKEGWTPLEYAIETLQPESERAIKAFVPIGMDDKVHEADILGRTGLMLAIIRNDLPFAERQVNHGARVDVRDTTRFENTPLHFAVIRRNNLKPFVELLLDNAADPNAPNAYGETPLHYLIKYDGFASPERDEVARMLIQKGADINQKNKRGLSPLQIASEKSPSFAKRLESMVSR